MKILNKINDLTTDDWSDEELVRDTMLKACKKIVSLMEELKEAQTYKADAEYYRWIRENWQKFLAIVDSWPISRLEEGIEQAMREENDG